MHLLLSIIGIPFNHGIIFLNNTKSIFHQFFSFAGAGIIGTAGHYLLFLSLIYGVGSPVLFATTMGFLLGAIINYWLSYHYVFKSDTSHRTAITRFFFVAGVGLIANNATVVVMTLDFGLNPLFSQLAATLLVLVWNFTANKLWTFNHEKSA